MERLRRFNVSILHLSFFIFHLISGLWPAQRWLVLEFFISPLHFNSSTCSRPARIFRQQSVLIRVHL